VSLVKIIRISPDGTSDAACVDPINGYQAIVDGIADINAQPDEEIDGRSYPTLQWESVSLEKGRHVTRRHLDNVTQILPVPAN
jgi:hypothetical protein